jgi:sn-glycerol 3-phosphate transport system permease protein
MNDKLKPAGAIEWMGANLAWPTLVCACAALIWLTPFLWMVAASFRPDSGGMDIASVIPKLPLSIVYFKDALDSAQWGMLYTNTILFTFGTLSVQLITITTAGYVFAFGKFKAKEIVFHLFLVQLMLVPVVLMVPNMMTIKSISSKDWGNTIPISVPIRRPWPTPSTDFPSAWYFSIRA